MKRIVFLLLFVFSIGTTTFSIAQVPIKRKKEAISVQQMDSAQLLNCLYNGYVINDEYLNPVFKVDTNIHDKVMELLATTTIRGHSITYKSIFGRYGKDDPEEIRFDSSISNVLTLDSFKFDFALLRTQPQSKYKDYGILQMSFWESQGEARYSNRKGNKYILLKGERVGCNGFYCGGFYLLVIDLNHKNPDIYIIDYPPIFPLTFNNLVMNRDTKNGYLSTYYYDTEEYAHSPKVKVAISSLVLKNKQAVVDTINKPSITSFTYRYWTDNPVLRVYGKCR